MRWQINADGLLSCHILDHLRFAKESSPQEPGETPSQNESNPGEQHRTVDALSPLEGGTGERKGHRDRGEIAILLTNILSP